MRAGAFSESRVVDLINRRFIPFFYNVSGVGEGDDPAARAFVGDSTENEYAFLAAFAPDGEYLGETELYADKDAVFQWLRGRLEEHADLDELSERELALLDAEESGTPADILAAAGLHEELGYYDGALTRYAAVAAAEPSLRGACDAGRLRILRYLRDWTAHAAAEAAARAAGVLGADVLALEHGHRLIELGAYTPARDALQPATAQFTNSAVLAELHFLAGRAAWFEQDRDWAKLHWCWILEHRPEDRVAMRARIAAAAEGMPYANPELAQYSAPVGNIGTEAIVAAVESAREVYRALLPAYEAGDYRKPRELEAAPDAATDSGPAEDPRLVEARELVGELSDAAADYPKSSKASSALQDLGGSAVAPLVAALNDKEFKGRGHAANTLAKLLAQVGSRPEEAIAALDAACEDEDSKVRTLAKSGRRFLSRFEPKSAAEIAAEASGIPEDAEGLVAILSDDESARAQSLLAVAALEKLGEGALDPLLAAVAAEQHAGQGWAAHALGRVLIATGKRPVGALGALAELAQRGEPGVRDQARAALSALEL